MKNQKAYTEEALFDYFLVSSQMEDYVHCQRPFYIERDCYDQMVTYSEGINRLCLRVLRGLQDTFQDFLPYIEDFPMRERILGLRCPVAPMFWTRFDTFREEETGAIRFAEFNYDKPCAQKEMGMVGKDDFTYNVNKNFESHFIQALSAICEDYRPGQKAHHVAVLVDPCHYEELHLGYYFQRLMAQTSVVIHQVGPKNLWCDGQEVRAFGEQKIDVILRLYPTEYLYEVTDMPQILDCFEAGGVLLINDPRVVAIQVKNLFVYLWELVNRQDARLSEQEQELIRASIPYSQVFDKRAYEAVRFAKDQYVVKPSFGRYSQEVYIGKLHTQEAWDVVLDQVAKLSKDFIIQQMIAIRAEYTYEVEDNDMTRPVRAYGNFGTYLIHEEMVGLCVRWSEDFLTDNDTTWMSGIGVKDYPVTLIPCDHGEKERKALWDCIHERAIFEHGFIGGYYRMDEYMSLDALVLQEVLFQEMKNTGDAFVRLLEKVQQLIMMHYELFFPVLGIPECLYEVVRTSHTQKFCGIGRIDFVLSQAGALQILEFNSETPAGIIECMGITGLIQEMRQLDVYNPNAELRGKLRKVFAAILTDFKQHSVIKTIAFVSCNYYEDLMISRSLAEIAKEIGDYNVVVGNIYDIVVEEDKAYLYGKQIDAIYRHYPLDWLAEDEALFSLRAILGKGIYSLNPTHTLITQSKAIFAVIYSLLEQGFFSAEEAAWIKRYIPYTAVVPDHKISHDCVAKPYFSREGIGVQMSYDGITRNIWQMVFQDRVDLMPMRVTRYTTLGATEVVQFPVMGMYIVGDEADGVFTRIGDFVTDVSANFMPTFVALTHSNNKGEM
ncbi:MAG: glutathionylspermidine synthase family protein [Cellulosilyticaceae bacterium]